MANINEYFLTLFSRLFFANFMFCLAFLFMVLALSFQQIPLYYASSGLWITCLLYIFKEFMRLRSFQENIDFKNNDDEPEITVNLNDSKILKVCKLYSNGMSMPQIMKTLGFKHPNQVARALRKGIKELLKKEAESLPLPTTERG